MARAFLVASATKETQLLCCSYSFVVPTALLFLQLCMWASEIPDDLFIIQFQEQ